ncbi:Cytochrome p450 [Thalictrum thalictroides]|uniref:Cytochrome p450 n=1 Tax=Thalictrum thalictroides TaxID=46969 RepID=A0A7J6XBI5_THATH|nr:Cytochrome p450 [Thalictrum thalictroides]
MDSFTELLGGLNVQDVDTFVHKYLRNFISSLFGPENLKQKLLPEIEQNARTYLQLWSSQQSVELKDGISAMIFYFSAKKMISYDEAKSSAKLRENFADFIKGLISFPVNIPGTTYYKCLQGRKKAMKFLKHTLDQRRASPEMHHGDFLDLIIEELKKEDSILTEGFALDLIFVLLFASYETTSSALTLGVKFLVEHPLVLEELKKEHGSIIRNRESQDTGLTWIEYKSMTFTFMVINEILRLANVAPGLFRKTLKEVKLKGMFKSTSTFALFISFLEKFYRNSKNHAGYTIPQGWAVMISPPIVHLNPLNYEDPLIFNPWRWKDVETTGGSKNFIAFGGGSRFCVGAEMAKVQMAVFLHCLVTEYRWTIIKGGEVIRAPGLMFPNGVHVQLTKNQ